MIPRWKRQNEKVTFRNNAFGIGNFSPSSSNGPGIGTNWYPSASPNYVFRPPETVLLPGTGVYAGPDIAVDLFSGMAGGEGLQPKVIDC